MSSKYRLIILVVINLAIITGLCYGFEYYLKLSDPLLKLPFDSRQFYKNRRFYAGYNLQVPPEGYYTWGHRVEYNPVGFRERDFEVPKPKGVCRIMVLGDSLSWGVGLALEDRYTNLIQTRLNKEFPGKTFEVLNFALTGGPTVAERDILRNYKDLVNPDLVVVGFFYNDPQPKSQGYVREAEEFYQKNGPLLDAIPEAMLQLGFPQIARATQQAIKNFLITSQIIPSWEVGLQRTYEENSTEWQAFIQALQDINGMSNEMGLPPPIFAVLNLESPSDRKNSETSIYFRWNDQAQQSAAQLGFRSYNHESEFAAKLAPDDISINVLDRHPSAKTHQIYADKLFEIIAGDVATGKLCPPQSSQQPQPVANAPLANKRLMRVKLGDTLRFLGYTADFKPDETLELTFGWQTLAQVDTNNSIFIYLRDENSRRWAERQTLPCNGDCSTIYWPPKMLMPPDADTMFWWLSAQPVPLNEKTLFERIYVDDRVRRDSIDILPIPIDLLPVPAQLADIHPLTLDPQMPAGTYSVVMSMYNSQSGRSLPAYDEIAETRLPQNEILLGTITFGQSQK